MTKIVKLQVTEQVERTGDKENGTSDLVDWGTVYLWPIGRLYSSFTACWKAVWFIIWFIYGLLKGCTVHCMVYLQPVGRPYGSFYGP